MHHKPLQRAHAGYQPGKKDEPELPDDDAGSAPESGDKQPE